MSNGDRKRRINYKRYAEEKIKENKGVGAGKAMLDQKNRRERKQREVSETFENIWWG